MNLIELLGNASHLGVWQEGKIVWLNELNLHEKKPNAFEVPEGGIVFTCMLMVADENIIYNNEIELLVIKSNNKLYYIPYPMTINKILSLNNSNLIIDFRFFITNSYYEYNLGNTLYSKSLIGEVDLQNRKGFPFLVWDCLLNDFTGATPRQILEVIEFINISRYYKIINEYKIIQNSHKKLNLEIGKKIY